MLDEEDLKVLEREAEEEVRKGREGEGGREGVSVCVWEGEGRREGRTRCRGGTNKETSP